MSKQQPKFKISEWISDKLNLSLTLKLNFRTTFDLLKTFIKLNIIILFALLAFMVYKADKDLIKAKYEINTIDKSSVVFLDSDINMYENNKYDYKKYDYYIPLNFFGYNTEITSRNIRMRTGRFFIDFRALEYTIDVSVGEEKYILGYNLYNFYYGIGAFMIGLSVVEFMFVFTQLFRSRKNIEKSLNPIKELTETVKKINGSDLDKRISILGTQNEFVDLTQEINAMLDRIQNSYESQSRFVSDASHELRTPISVIQGYANLIDRWGKEDPEILKESIEAIQSETESMKTLVEQLLFLARGDRENLAASKDCIEVSAIIKEIFNESKVIDKNHEYILEKIEKAWLLGDINLIKQAIRIFMDNAKKYTENGGKITLEVYVKEENVIITIEDEGLGMDKDEIGNMFERFFRADKARTRKDGGSGLGLSIADQILRLHNANVEILSVPNLGTKVFLSFPLAKKREEFNIA